MISNDNLPVSTANISPSVDKVEICLTFNANVLQENWYDFFVQLLDVLLFFILLSKSLQHIETSQPYVPNVILCELPAYVPQQPAVHHYRYQGLCDPELVSLHLSPATNYYRII